MDFIKKNYEKIILGLVLLILAGAACYLPFYVTDQKDYLEQQRVNTKPNVKELPPVDTSAVNAAYQRTQSPSTVDFTGNNHNTLNPVIWKKFPDGRLNKTGAGNDEGPDALVITKTHPLKLIVSFGSPSAAGFLIAIERQNMVSEQRRHTQNFVSPTTKSELLSLHEVKGAADKPELHLEWNETGEQIVVTPDKPFERVDGYSADLKYPPENKTWTDRRVGARLVFANGVYNIVAITESNVVVSAESNKKKTTIDYHSAP